jgi:hypothetical protein
MILADEIFFMGKATLLELVLAILPSFYRPFAIQLESTALMG